MSPILKIKWEWEEDGVINAFRGDLRITFYELTLHPVIRAFFSQKTQVQANNYYKEKNHTEI